MRSPPDTDFAPQVERLLLPHLPPPLAAAQARFCAALAAASSALNLTGVLDPRGMAFRHVLDSLLARPLLTGAGPLADLGSGGGVPGIPLALALPRRQVVLLESRQRKAAALARLVDDLGLSPRVSVVAERGEAWLAAHPVDEVVVRAVGSIARVLEVLSPLRDHVGAVVLLKGPAADAELAEARARLSRWGFAEPERLDAELPEGEGRRVLLRFRGGRPLAPATAG